MHKNECPSLRPHKCPSLGPLAANTPHKLHVLREDGHTLGVDRAEVGVFKQNGEICLRRGLGRHNGVRLEAEIGFEILGHLRVCFFSVWMANLYVCVDVGMRTEPQSRILNYSL